MTYHPMIEELAVDYAFVKCKEGKSPICAEIFDTKGHGHVAVLARSRVLEIEIKTFHLTACLPL